MFSSRSQKLLQCGNYFHYEITKETKSRQLLRQCPSLVPSPRYFGRRFLFRFTWSSKRFIVSVTSKAWGYGRTTKNYCPGFCDIDCHRFKTNKRTTNSKMLRQKAKQNRRTTAKMDNGRLTLCVSDGFQCDLSKLLTVWDFVNNLRFLSDKSYGWNLKIVCSGWVNW